MSAGFKVGCRYADRFMVIAMADDRASEVDWRPMLRRALAAAAIGLVVRVTAMWQVASNMGAHLVRRTWHGVPYGAFRVPPQKFVVITSSSSVALSFVTLAIVIAATIGRQHRVKTLGWMFSGFGLLVSLLVDAVLHHLRYPYTDPVRMRWAVGSAVLVIMITLMWVGLSEPATSLRSARPRPHPSGLTLGAGLATAFVVLTMAAYATTGHPTHLT